MVGGAISGDCAIGSVESAITPRSVMTMLITPAKIGRSIKKCGKFMACAPPRSPRSFFGLGLGGAGLLVPGNGRLLGHWSNLHPRLQQLQTRRNNFLAIFQSAFDDSLALENRAGLK